MRERLDAHIALARHIGNLQGSVRGLEEKPSRWRRRALEAGVRVVEQNAARSVSSRWVRLDGSQVRESWLRFATK